MPLKSLLAERSLRTGEFKLFLLKTKKVLEIQQLNRLKIKTECLETKQEIETNLRRKILKLTFPLCINIINLDFRGNSEGITITVFKMLKTLPEPVRHVKLNWTFCSRLTGGGPDTTISPDFLLELSGNIFLPLPPSASLGVIFS